MRLAGASEHVKAWVNLSGLTRGKERKGALTIQMLQFSTKASGRAGEQLFRQHLYPFY